MDKMIKAENIPCTEHFDFILEEYDRELQYLKAQSKTAAIRRRIDNLTVQKTTLEIARQSYLDDFE